MKRKVLSLFLCMIFVVSMAFTGCGAKNEETKESSGEKQTTTETKSDDSKKEETAPTEAASTVADPDAYAVTEMEDTTIRIRVMNAYGNIDPVIAKYEEMVADDPIMSKIHLEFEYVTGADYKDKLAMAISTQEDYDLMFCGSWHGFDSYASANSFADLSKYFGNDNFPGLKAAFSEDLIKAATSNVQNADGTWSSYLYRIPLLEQITDIRGLLYREDLRQKLGCAEIVDDDTMYAFAKAVKESNELTDYIPISMNSGFFRWTQPMPEVSANVYEAEIMGANLPFFYRISDDGKTVLGAAVPGDADDLWSFMPEGYQYDYIKEWYQNSTKWADYLDPVRGTTETGVGNAAILYATLTEAESKFNELYENEELMAAYPDATFKFYPIFENMRNKEKHSIVSEMIANNQLIVPSWSEKVDAVMCFMNWMMSSQENHDLFQFGIEGVDWNPVGEDGYELITLPEDQDFTMPGYSFTWNPTYVRKSSFIANNEELSSYYDYMMDPDSYVLSKVSGFTFDTKKVETEIANLSSLVGETKFHLALYGNETATQVEKFHEKAENVGLELVRQELLTQLQAFLDNKNSAQ